ncbi:hypothetical protein V3C99_012086, partial [Haemonchus contortus]
MKSVVEADCGAPNALVGLAQNYGSSNQRTVSSIRHGATALLPSSSLGENFANDFLHEKASNSKAPSTFSVKALLSQLPKQSTSSTSLANSWAMDYQNRPGQQLASLWSQQYSTTRPAYENVWAGATSTSSNQSLLKSSTSVDSAMWSAEFLDNAETSLHSSPVSHALANELAENWAQAYATEQQNVGERMESEWESIRQKLNIDQAGYKTQSEAYEYQASNPFLSSTDPMAEGDQMMQEGDLRNAMLAYEAAVQKNPNDAE